MGASSCRGTGRLPGSWGVGGAGGGRLALGAQRLVAPEARLKEDDQLAAAHIKDARQIHRLAVDLGLKQRLAGRRGDLAEVGLGLLDVGGTGEAAGCEG